MNVINLLKKAIDDFSNAKYDSALIKLNHILILQSNNFDALQITGAIYGIKGNHLNASNYFRKALEINPSNKFVNFNLAKSLSELGNEYEAIQYHLKTIELDPNFEDAWINYGKSLMNIERNTDAINCFDEVIRKNNNSISAFINKASALYKLKKYEKALEILFNTLTINPNYPIIFNNIGVVMVSMQKYSEAIIYLERAIELDNNYYEAINCLGAAYNELSEYDKAKIYFKKAVEIKNDYAEAWSNLGTSYSETGNYSESIACFEKAIEINPFYAEAYCNLGSALNDIGEYSKALGLYKEAIKIDSKYPESHYNLANYYLGRFNFIEGWAEYKWRFFTKKSKSIFLPTSRPEWTGLNSNARLYIWAEQGIGDQILYSSMLPNLSNYKNKIIVSVEKKLINIFRNSFTSFTFIERGEALDEKEYDEQIPIGSLGMFLRRSINDFPGKNIFLMIKDSMRLIQYKEKLNHNKICGISWKSVNKHLGIHKSIPLEQMEPIFQNKHFNFINLQYGDVTEDLSAVNNTILHFNELNLFNNIEDLMLLIALCEIVVTASNTTAHISGAMGKKTLLLVPNSKGKMWYWNDLDGKCLWYPSIQIVNQDEKGDWGNAIEKVSEILREL